MNLYKECGSLMWGENRTNRQCDGFYNSSNRLMEQLFENYENNLKKAENDRLKRTTKDVKCKKRGHPMFGGDCTNRQCDGFYNSSNRLMEQLFENYENNLKKAENDRLKRSETND